MDTKIERIVQGGTSTLDLINNELIARTNEKPFYVVSMKDIQRKHATWLAQLPRVKPFYAVKCNNLPEVVAFLSMLGTGFDCASKQEIDQVLALGVNPSNIIYANPCKTRSFIKHAAKVGVDVMTFDNELELRKIAQVHPNARLVLRIKGDDRSAKIKLNSKFGAEFNECYSLLELARDLNLNVVGVSFHNGSDCEDANAYKQSIALCKDVFEIGDSVGHSMYLLDIGGGFPGFQEKSAASFQEYARVINEAIDKQFPAVNPITGKQTNFEIIAEPGRYYVASAFDFVAMVIAKRIERDAKTGNEVYSYYLNDGVYGAFNNCLVVGEVVEPQLIGNAKEINHRYAKHKLHLTTFWGPTCDSLDCIRKNFMFPKLDIGEWILFKNMGAYTTCLASNFNGFDKASVIIAI